LTIFPVPFLASIGFNRILEKIETVKPSSLRLRYSKKHLTFIFIGIIFVSSVTTVYAYTSSTFFNQWLSQSAYEKLKWLSKNYHHSEKPIFILNDADRYAGVIGVLNNDWIEAIYGDHYSYLGSIRFFLALMETPFIDQKSRIISAIFLEKMLEADIFRELEITHHNIIVVQDFFIPRPLPKYFRDNFNEIHDGIFVLNITKFEEMDKVNIPLYSSLNSSSGSWYSIEQNWTDSVYALEFYEKDPFNKSYCEFLIPITKPGNYSFVLRYWDGFGSEKVLLLNDYFLGNIHLKGTSQPKNYKSNIWIESEGIYTFKIVLTYSPGNNQYASLDYLEVSNEDNNI
jgi:hypothetical protein